MIVLRARPDAGRSSVDPIGYRTAPEAPEEMLVRAGMLHMVLEDIDTKEIKQINPL